MRFCYADPPYPGMAHLYKGHPDYAGEVDHAALIARLVDEFPDGWALSTASTTLRLVLPMCPDDVRVGAWVKPWASWKPGVYPAYAWEPVIFRSARHQNYTQTPVDWVAAPVTLKRSLVGAKPDMVCFWLFRCLGALPGDELCDLFPGSGAVGRAWDKYQRQVGLPLDYPREKQEKLPLGVA